MIFLQINSSEMLLQLLDNSVLTWGLIACGIAQCSKLVFELITLGKLRPEVLIETGGMPSSHSALVTGTASALGIELGFDDPIFALSVMVAFVVMYDASGIRRAAGLIAKRVNQLSFEVSSESSNSILKESIGHTRLEVLIGSLLGPAIALPGIILIGSPLHLMETLGLLSA